MWRAVLAFDPSRDGRLLAGDCLGGPLTVWNWRTGTTQTLPAQSRFQARIPRGGNPACLLAVSPDGTRAAQSHLGGGASLWDLAQGRRLAADLTSGLAVRDVAWSPGGERLAVAAGKAATIVDRSGRELSSTPNQVDFVTSVAFDPNGDLIVTASRDGVARVWDVRSAAALAELRGHTDEIVDAVFTADGRVVVTLALDGTIRSWQVVEGRVIRHADWVLDAAFSPDGQRIATAAADGSARISPLRGGRAVSIEGLFAPLQLANSIGFDPAGGRVVAAGGHDARQGGIVVADATDGRVRQEMLPAGLEVRSADFSPDGDWLVTTAVGAPPALWRLSDYSDAGPNEPTETLEIPSGRWVLWAEFSPDGRSIVTAANDGVARVFDAQTRRQTRELKTPGLMFGATFSADSRRILTYGSDFIGRIWDARTGRQLADLRGHSSWISRGAFSPDGRTVVTGGADQTTRVWDSRTGRVLSIQRMHGDSVNSVAYSPDGKQLLSGSDDRTARVYRCATCVPVEDLVRLAGDRIVSRGG
jgi:WD40 repeat protein